MALGNRSHAILDRARRIAAAPDADAVLRELLETIRETLAMTGVANRLVAADDEYEACIVSGSAELGEALLGARYPQAAMEGLLNEAYAVAPNLYLLPPGAPENDAFPGPIYKPSEELPAEPGGWHIDNELLVALRDRNGRILAIISSDEPEARRIPEQEPLDDLAVLAVIASTTLEARIAQAQAERAHAEATTLAAIAGALDAGQSDRQILEQAVAGVAQACGYRGALASFVDPLDGSLAHVAAYGERHAALIGKRTPREVLDWALSEEHRQGGCYVVQSAAAVEQGAEILYETQEQGRGTRGWRDHHLLVPIRLPGEGLLGMIQVDDPTDRMIPSEQQLTLLAAFARQIALVLSASRHLEAARRAASRDPLTGLANRSAAIDALAATLTRGPIALLFMDVDNLKPINDRLGHSTGDRVLIEVGDRLRTVVRPGDTVARIAGDEFLVICAGVDTPDAASELALRAGALFDRHISTSAGQLAVSASIGVALATPGDDPQTVIDKADQAMYHAKRSGKGRHALAEAS